MAFTGLHEIDPLVQENCRLATALGDLLGRIYRLPKEHREFVLADYKELELTPMADDADAPGQIQEAPDA